MNIFKKIKMSYQDEYNRCLFSCIKYQKIDGVIIYPKNNFGFLCEVKKLLI